MGWKTFSGNNDFLVWPPSEEVDRRLVISKSGPRKTSSGDITFEFAIWHDAGGWDRQAFPEHVKTLDEKKAYALTLWRLEL